MNSIDETIVSLANILNVQQINNKVVEQALKLICRGCSFEGGLVYEISMTNQFRLVQHYGLPSEIVYKEYEINFLKQQDQTDLALNLLSVIERNDNNTLLDKNFLDLYEAQCVVLMPVVDGNHNVYGFVILFDKATDRKRSDKEIQDVSMLLAMLMRYVGVSMYERKFVQIQATLESILDNAGVDIYVNDFYTHDILYTNESMAEPYGGKEEFWGRKCWQVLFPGQSGPCEFCPQKNLIDENGKPTKVYSWDYQRAFDGSWFRVFSAAFHWVDGRLSHVVSSANITDNKRNESIIENLANYDQLTQLPNRRSLIKECEKRIANATPDEKGYILFIDIDRFKNINDSYGHDAGDEFLVQLSQFFSEIPLLKNAIYRNGGDEFVAVISGESITKSNITHLANFIHERFKKAWNLKAGDAICSASIGIACFQEDGGTIPDLLQIADKAMYQVKKAGGAGLCFGYELLDK